MKFIISLLALLVPLCSLAGNGSGNVSSVIGYGMSLNTAAQPGVVVPSSSTSEYAVSCGHGTSDITDGKYYKCFKQDTNGSGTQWAIASGAIARCKGFFTATNVTTTVGVIFGHGTAVVTHNGSTPPTGNVTFMGNGAYSWTQPATTMPWHSLPLTFRAVGSIVYPYAQIFGSAAKMTITLICTES